MQLFKYENYQVSFSPYIISIKAFRNIINKDKSKDKEKSVSLLSFIYFYVDPRSDYMYLIDDESRCKLICEHLGLPNNILKDKDVKEAISVYKELVHTISSDLLQTTKELISKLQQQLKDIDINEKDDKGKLVYSPQQIAKTINEVPDLIETLNKVQKKVFQEIQENENIRGDQELAVLEDGVRQKG